MTEEQAKQVLQKWLLQKGFQEEFKYRQARWFNDHWIFYGTNPQGTFLIYAENSLVVDVNHVYK